MAKVGEKLCVLKELDVKPKPEETLRCSFCHQSQDAVAKLISSPSDYPRAYICDECVTVCNSILEDDRTESHVNAVEVVLEFERLINSHNVEAIAGLLTEDSVFVDSLGQKIQGVGNLRGAWTGYFRMVPDYSISHSEIFSNGDTVAMFGIAQGTFARGAETKTEDFWKTPASWRAVVKSGKIAEWQVFADNEPIRAIMRKYQ